MTSSISRVAALLLGAGVVLSGCGRDTPESLVASAKEFTARKDHKSAAIQLRNALQKEPGNAEARFLLGREMLAAGDVVTAEKELRRAWELKYPVDQVAPPLAISLVALGEYKKVLDELSGVSVTQPLATAELQSAIGEAHLALGNRAAAQSAFDAALVAQPQYVTARLGQARVAAVAGDLPRALAIVDAAIAIDAAVAETWQLKGDILSAQDQRDAALSAFRKSIEIRPTSVRAHAAAVLLLIQENKLDEAGQQLEAMKRVAPKHPQTYYVDALHNYRTKKLPAAEQAIQQALSLAPDNTGSLVLGAIIKLDLQSYAQAEAYAQKVLSRAPNQPLARRVLVVTYLRSGQAAKAIDALQPALASAGKDANLLALAAEAYMVNGEAGKASEYFARAAALAPDNTKLRTALALSRLAAGDSERGLSELEQTAAVDTGIRADLALISSHLQRRAYDRALTAIATLEKKQPGPLPHNLRGGALLAKKDIAGARKSFEQALQIEPTYFAAAVNLARLDLAEKKPDAAQGRFEAILAKDPKHAQALLALAELRANNGGTPGDVSALIDRAIAAQPAQPGARVALMRHYVSHKEFKKAVSAAQEAMAAMPDNIELMDAAARTYQAAGEMNQALAIYKKITQLQPGATQPYVRMAEAQLAAKQLDAAAGSLSEALAVKPDALEAQRALIAVHLSADHIEDALAVARQVQKQRPREPDGYVFEGDIYGSKKNWTDAANAYRAGLRQATKSTVLAIRLNTALVAAGNAAAASQFATSWLKANPQDYGFRAELAQAALAGNKFDVAREHYLAILRDQPSNPIVLNNLAWVAAQLKDPQAIRYAEKAYALAPGHPAVMDTLGTLLLDGGDTARAVDLLRKASAGAPNVPDIRLNLARGLIKIGDRQGARVELDSLTKLGDKYGRQAEVTRLRQQL
jgi:putative PEP-CTERM system TPR-repeat lipoprotein